MKIRHDIIYYINMSASLINTVSMHALSFLIAGTSEKADPLLSFNVFWHHLLFLDGYLVLIQEHIKYSSRGFSSKTAVRQFDEVSRV